MALTGEKMEKKWKDEKQFWKGMISGLLVATVVLCVTLFGSKIYQMISGEETRAESTDLLGENVKEKVRLIRKTIDTYYLNDIDNTAMEDGIYKGVVESLDDPYSVYFTEEELDSMMETSSGVYYGVGLYLAQDPDTMEISVIKPMKNSPAGEVGIKADDVLYAVEGIPVEGQDLSEVVAQVKGQEGTKVHLTMLRGASREKIDFEVERREIESETVSYEIKEKGIGYLAISEFDDITYKQFQDGMDELEKQGMKSLILDLRGNPGGNLDTVVDIADLLLPRGMIVYTEDKKGVRQEFKSDEAHKFQKPLVVLIDENSASASEILAGAIKDYGIGKLVGTTTFGKGIVQRIISLGDGTAVKLTISKYYTPKGVNIHEIGIEPDVSVEFDQKAYEKNETDNQLDKALELLN